MIPSEGNRRVAPAVPSPEPLEFSEEERREIAEHVCRLYNAGVMARAGAGAGVVGGNSWANRHKIYDQMFRGQVEEFANREGPWEGSSRLHIQMPYWLVSAINSRMVHGIWGQNPLVVGTAEEDDDQEVAQDAALQVEWNLQPARMNARARWSRASQIRLVHGVSASLLSYAHDPYHYRVSKGDEEEAFQFGPKGELLTDDVGNPVKAVSGANVDIVEGTYYQGPVIHPLEYDDVIVPLGCMNLQPRRHCNPGGAEYVIVRTDESLSGMWGKADEAEGAYAFLFADGRDRNWWVSNAPTQPSSLSGDQNTQRRLQQEKMEGISSAQVARKDRNPDFEILVHFGLWEHPDTKEEVEVVMFVCRRPEIYLGGFLLSDLMYTGDRPLMELHHQTVSNRYYSMGICELAEHLSEEIDTIHNMRLDVGFATNMPWYFVRASAGIKASEIKLKPLALIPVEDPRDVVAPQVQNVTSFYHQEETLLLSIVERVFGVGDMFLGMSPTSGAAARTATGFLGTQEESGARMSEFLVQDAEAFSFLCRTVYHMEMQFGPDERTFRLLGEEGGASKKKLSRDDLWMRGTYDFRLGANAGTFSQFLRYQQASTAYQMFSQSPLVAQDMGRLWELSADVLRAMGYRKGDVEKIIGPKSAVAAPSPKSQEEENAQMAQFAFGWGISAPTHPNDNDQEHMQKTMEFISSPEYEALGKPNPQAFYNHAMAHQQQQAGKQQQQMMMAQGAGAPGAPKGPQGASVQQRAASQMGGQQAGSQGSFGETYKSQTRDGGGSTGINQAMQGMGKGGGGNGIPSPPRL